MKYTTMDLLLSFATGLNIAGIIYQIKQGGSFGIYLLLTLWTGGILIYNIIKKLNINITIK